MTILLEATNDKYDFTSMTKTHIEDIFKQYECVLFNGIFRNQIIQGM